jgi:DNA primase
LARVDDLNHPTYLVLDLDPPDGGFSLAAKAAELVRHVLLDMNVGGAVKTSGAKGLHIFVPLDGQISGEDAAAATRAIAARAELGDPRLATTAYILKDRKGRVFLDSTRAGFATVVAAYSPRIRPGTPVSFPISWDDLASVSPADFTVRNAVGLLAGEDPWNREMPEPQRLDPDLIAEGHTIPVARVQAMHEGKRRARTRRESKGGSTSEGDGLSKPPETT